MNVNIECREGELSSRQNSSLDCPNSPILCFPESTIQAFQFGINKLKVIFRPIFRKNHGLIVDEIAKTGPFKNFFS